MQIFSIFINTNISLNTYYHTDVTRCFWCHSSPFPQQKANLRFRKSAPLKFCCWKDFSHEEVTWYQLVCCREGWAIDSEIRNA